MGIRVFQFIDFNSCALASCYFLFYEIAVGIINEIVLLIEAFYFVTPDVSITFAFVIAVQAGHITVVVDDSLEVAQSGIGCDAQTVFELMAVVEAYFPSVGMQVAIVSFQ